LDSSGLYKATNILHLPEAGGRGWRRRDEEGGIEKKAKGERRNNMGWQRIERPSPPSPCGAGEGGGGEG